MTPALIFVLSLSSVFAAIIGIVRFRQIDRSYYPFLWAIWLGLAVEIIVFILMKQRMGAMQNAVMNVFALIDCLLFTLLFYRWSLFKKNRNVLYGLVAFFVITWAVVTFYIGNFFENNWHFRLIYSFALIFFSVTYFNKLVVNERGNMLRNSRFLICIGLIIFYTVFTIVCATALSFLSSGESPSNEFRRSLQIITVCSNVFVNLLYALAVLWIPRKKHFTTVY